MLLGSLYYNGCLQLRTNTLMAEGGWLKRKLIKPNKNYNILEIHMLRVFGWELASYFLKEKEYLSCTMQFFWLFLPCKEKQRCLHPMNKLRLYTEIQNNKIYLSLNSKDFKLRENILSVSKWHLHFPSHK